ncbi:hypothetical protein FF011L_12580 [Roseimaritima multifibrata]|uniref:Uncharacterized protein n=1 Tax=Roseimaritima multifibrata TaxID=1930274 RepID=A0A517MCA3_9BACT|nr:hypothetical protein FF011L_12580 [Roseimaritima multifibrata]
MQISLRYGSYPYPGDVLDHEELDCSNLSKTGCIVAEAMKHAESRAWTILSSNQDLFVIVFNCGGESLLMFDDEE